MVNSLLACPRQAVFVVVLADRAPAQLEVVIRPFHQTEESDIVKLMFGFGFINSLLREMRGWRIGESVVPEALA